MAVQRRIYSRIVFIYQYLAGAFIPLLYTVLTRGSVPGLLLGVIAVAVLYLLVCFGIGWKTRDKEWNQEKRNQLPIALVLVLLFAMFIPVQAEDGEAVVWLDLLGTIVIGCWLFAVFAAYLYVEYYYEKYITMYENPSVSAETIRRFEQNTALVLKKRLFLFVGGLVLLFGLLGMLPTTELAVPRQSEPIQIEDKKSSAPKATTDLQEQLKEAREKKKEKNPTWEMFLVILRLVLRVVVVLLALLGVCLILFFIYRRFFSLRRPQLSGAAEPTENIREGIDEYISLKPVYREKVGFSSDNNGKIRRYFYQYIRKRAKGSVNMSLTPYELTETYGASGDGNLSDREKEAVRIYEKARYSGKTCLDEEVEKMRRFS